MLAVCIADLAMMIVWLDKDIDYPIMISVMAVNYLILTFLSLTTYIMMSVAVCKFV